MFIEKLDIFNLTFKQVLILFLNKNFMFLFWPKKKWLILIRNYQYLKYWTCRPF